MSDRWVIPSHRKHAELLMDLGWELYAAITGAMIRDVGAEAFEALSETMVRRHQQNYFVDGLRKLGLMHERTDAIRAAKYHCYSNVVAGLRMGYAEESPDKAWVFYLTPSPVFHDSAGLSMLRPEYWVRIARGWHSQNGQSLGNPGLQAVVTHATGRGDSFDAMYFLNRHERLAPEETLKVSWGEPHPPIEPVRLDPEVWPEERYARGLRNYLVGYVAAYICEMLLAFGSAQTAAMLRYAYGITLFQRLDTLRDSLEAPAGHPFAAALMLKRFHQVFGDDPALTEEGDRVTVSLEASRLHRTVALQSEGAVQVPPEVEDAITDAWATLTGYVNPGVRLEQTASPARGDEKIAWTFRRA